MDILGVKRPGVPLILRQQPSVEAQTQFPEIGHADPGPGKVFFFFFFFARLIIFWHCVAAINCCVF